MDASRILQVAGRCPPLLQPTSLGHGALADQSSCRIAQADFNEAAILLCCDARFKLRGGGLPHVDADNLDPISILEIRQTHATRAAGLGFDTALGMECFALDPPIRVERANLLDAIFGVLDFLN